ncbi:DNA polymerase III subunit beta [Corynebacterium aquilae]|uniref:Beta sliding clamp n=1 Tax=Corynebacterium aquilae DSM 44791 TaxID=1431546 RepID=A0A1L7CD78_9CORY|nr:DNA polymerase III subunit beta [Corynebacterium aquilae]APT83743.1 DNA polymerase III subunit beta [Corynebacterium aquilae DSM 44791]
MDVQAVSFQVAKDDLAHAVGWVARNLPAKPAQPVLRGMLITADDEGLELAGFDYEVSTLVRIPAIVHTTGRIAVAGKLLSEIVSNLPSKPIDVQLDDSTVIFRCGSSRFELPSIPLEDYPQLPQLPAITGTIDPKLFVEAVSQVAMAAGKDDALPMLTGVNVIISGEEVTLVATDRFRLAVRQLQWNPQPGIGEATVLVPAKTLMDNARTLDTNMPDPVEIAIGDGEAIGQDGLFGLRVEARRTTTRLLDAQFPNHRPLLPATNRSVVIMDIPSLVDALRRVSLVTDRSESQIRMHFHSDHVVLSAGTAGGHAEETLPCELHGEEVATAFRSSFLRDGLGVLNSDKVMFGFTEAKRPAILVAYNGEELAQDDQGDYLTPDNDFRYVLMPVRLPS